MIERGSLEIKEADDDQYEVNIKLVEGTVWLTTNQIAREFGVFISKVTTTVISIYKNEILWEDETHKYWRYTNDKGTEVIADLYNLDVVIALAYRINSPKSKAFRKWIITCLAQELKKPEIHIIVNASSAPPTNRILN